MNKVYLASRYSRREELCGYRAQLEAIGIIVTSRWLNGSHQLGPCGTEKIGENGAQAVEGEGRDETAQSLKAFFAGEDVKDVADADTVISFTEPANSESSRGGRHVEYGLALATGKRLIVIGYRENIFHCLPQVEFYETWESLVTELGARPEVGK